MAVTLTSPATLVAVSQAALRTHACAKRGARSRSGVRAQQGFIFFFQQGSRSEARGQPAAPACQRPQENSPARAGTGHWAPGGAGQDGVPKEKCEGGAAGVNPGGGHLAFPGHPSGTRGLFWELAGRRVTGRGALPGGGGSASVRPDPAPLRTPGAHEASPPLLSATPHHHPRGPPCWGGPPPTPYLLPLLALPRLDEPGQDEGQNPSSPAPAPHGWGRLRGGWARAPPGKTARRGSASSPSARSQPGGDGEIAAGPPRGANRRREGRGRALTVCALGRPLRKAPPPS